VSMTLALASRAGVACPGAAVPPWRMHLLALLLGASLAHPSTPTAPKSDDSVGDDMATTPAPQSKSDFVGEEVEDDKVVEEKRDFPYQPWDPELLQPSGAPLHTFYMYRAVSDEEYPPINVNAASLGGVLWYLHNEVVIQYPRKFGITRISRIKVQTRATKPLMERNMEFGPRTAFDRGQCTGPYVCGRKVPKASKHGKWRTGKAAAQQPKLCSGAWKATHEGDVMPANGKSFNNSFEWGKYGYFVGCNNLGSYPFPMYKVYYPEATWYSLPGPCNSKAFDEHTPMCVGREPGGLCKGEPTGAGNCTWSYEEMGSVSVDDLIGISVKELHKKGGREYDPTSDRGVNTNFWNGISNTRLNKKRMLKLQRLFYDKFPNQTRDEDMPSPKCDFNFGRFYKEFYWRAPFEGKCTSYKEDSKCYAMAKWGKTDPRGYKAHPEWFPGLQEDSEIEEFMMLLYMQGKTACPHWPCGVRAPTAAASKDDDDKNDDKNNHDKTDDDD